MTLCHQYYSESILTKDIYIFSLWTSELHNLQLSWANKLLREVYLSNPIYNLKSKLKKIELYEPYYFNQISTSLRIYCPWLSAFCSSGVLSITPQAKPIPSSRALGLQSFRTIYIWAWPLCATLKEHHEPYRSARNLRSNTTNCDIISLCARETVVLWTMVWTPLFCSRL